MLMWRPAIAPVERPKTFDSAQLQRGARVVEAGDCAVCHTRPGGQYLAGGLPLETPFGTLYSTNITPDPQTGIGQWSLPAFERAMREGIARDGHFLYPAFPYVHYWRMSTRDIADAYAYLMSGPAVDSPARQNRMNFPMNIRPLVSFWNLLFLHAKPLMPVAQQSDAWNRGRYLVEGPGHCAGCHSPLNLIGAEKSGERLAGGAVDGWDAPSLLGMARRVNPWSSEQLERYLRAEVVDGRRISALSSEAGGGRFVMLISRPKSSSFQQHEVVPLLGSTAWVRWCMTTYVKRCEPSWQTHSPAPLLIKWLKSFSTRLERHLFRWALLSATQLSRAVSAI
ncbi:cytochrome c [Pseudomonas sp. FP2196]|nr:cytochrome c [Pseudomonas sp. FP2196]WLH38432.1 cytochrome c [Pseudomonas sp. FP2196]